MRGLKAKRGLGRAFWPTGSLFSLVLLAQGCPFLPTGTEYPVAQVIVVAEPVSFALGETSSATATLKDAYGNVLTDVEVTWSSSDESVATVTPNGGTTATLSGVGAGIATITARAEGKSGFAAVQVTSGAPARVSSVVVALGSSSLNVGATTHATATLRDAAGNVLSGRTVSWSSSNPAAATVSATGGPTATVAAVAPGSAEIIANAEGVTGRATVDVSDFGSGGGPLANECADPQPGWIWCDDFDQNRLSSYFEYVDQSGSFVRASGVGVEDSYAMRARFAAGQVDAGNLKLAFGETPDPYFSPVDAGTANYREIYWRIFLRHQPAWLGGGGDKLTRASVFATSSWAQAMVAHVWSGSSTLANYLVIDPASGTDEAGTLITTVYNDPNKRWLGSASSITPIFDPTHVGLWYCIETRVRLNDAGQANGVFEVWIDDQLEARRSGLNWLGSYDAYGINSVFLENWWNAGSVQAQERYLDNFVVSIQRIGC